GQSLCRHSHHHTCTEPRRDNGASSAAIKKLGDYISNLTRMDAHTNKMAEYLFDKHTLGGKS
uniref:Ferritin n=1 Tax=Labrus bergylta TaxID=56723 RepID=A0A3Q3H410_9LABR